MNLKSLTAKVTSKIGRQVLTARKNAPTVLFVTGVAGVIGTVVLASRATLKVEDIIDEAQERLDKVRNMEDDEYSEQDRKRDTVLVYAKAAGKLVKLYAPAAAVGGLSIMALSGSHIILNRRNVSLTAAYAALDKAFREYRLRVTEELGEEKETELRQAVRLREVVEKTDKGKDVISKAVPVGASPYAVLFDRYTNRNWSPESAYNALFLRGHQNYANDMLQSQGFVFLNDVYDMLGFPRTSAGQLVGWVKKGNGDGYIDFGIFDRNLDEALNFIRGDEKSIWLDFNVDGIVYDLIDQI